MIAPSIDGDSAKVQGGFLMRTPPGAASIANATATIFLG
jgi:hypothetical protein